MIRTIKKDCMINELEHLTAADVNADSTTKKKMNDFYKQTDISDDSSDFSTSEKVHEEKFEMMIFSNEKKKDEKESSNSNFIVDDNIIAT